MTVAELPVFPLGRVVLFPGALLPLHVFEPRYRALLKDCMAAGGRMVVAHIPDPDDLDAHGNPRFVGVVGVGEVIEHEPFPDGRANILLRGLHRARLEELPFVPPYRRVRATPLDVAPSTLASGEHAALVAAVTAFAAEVRRRDASFELRVPERAPPEVLVDLAAQHLIADAATRQAALEELDLGRRAAMVVRELAVQQRLLFGTPGGAAN